MSGDLEFALVLDPDTLGGMGGPRTWGVCRVSEDGAEPGFFDGGEEALAFAGTLPLVPGIPGHPTAAVPYDLEVEVISLLLDAAASMVEEADGIRPSRGADARPPGFSEVVPASFGGFAVVTGDHGLEFCVDLRLARTMGWKEGSRVSLCIDGSRRRLALCSSDAGPRLSLSLEGIFETEHAVPYPLEMSGTQPGSRLQPPYEVHDGGIVFRIPSTPPRAPVHCVRGGDGDHPEEVRPGSGLDVWSVVAGGLAAALLALVAIS